MSPAIYRAAFPAMGIDVEYEAWAVPPQEVESAILRLREDDMLGLNVTVPHKQAVLPLLDEVDPVARSIGAVNCVVKRDGRLIGYNTDKAGYIESLLEADCDPSGKRVVVLGVGGSSRAVCFGLAEAGAASITLSGRAPERVLALAEHLAALAPAGCVVQAAGWLDEACVAAIGDAGLVVNCTPIGMIHTPQANESPLPAALLRPGLWVSDLVYNPLLTVLLRDAVAAGARPVGGLEMLVLQAAECVRLWTGRQPPVDIMRAAARKAMGFEE
jgi:shikimate dehydrogenase